LLSHCFHLTGRKMVRKITKAILLLAAVGISLSASCLSLHVVFICAKIIYVCAFRST